MKSFSWTLALRYLNPLRTFVSIITLISLLGVAFGVMVLIVVLSVHNGFERNLKDTLLGFSPHIVVVPTSGEAIRDWQEQENRLAKVPDCVSAYAFIEGFALLDSKVWQQPINFRAIHSDNKAQIESLTELIDHKYPGTPEGRTAAMGLEAHVVMSKFLAERLGLAVGDEFRLLAARNLEAVMEVYNVPGERATELYPEIFTEFESVIRAGTQTEAGDDSFETEALVNAYRKLDPLVPSDRSEGEPMRKVEKEMIESILIRLFDPKNTIEGRDVFETGTQEEVLATLEDLRSFELKEADNEAFRSIEEFVKPQTFTVWAVYADNVRSQGPSIFIPLEIGMELKGLRGEAEGIGVLVKDPYKAEETAAKVRTEMGEEWLVRSWMETHANQFQLVKTEKGMMSFALSFITLLSAFSIMAVMYTVTVQKRQEIGVMKALGARPSQIVRVFLYQGVIVGIGGALLGLGLGLLAVRYRELIADTLRAFGVDPFPADFHGMTELPAHVESPQLIVICLVAIILCILAALVPALMAAFRDPAKSLRNL